MKELDVPASVATEFLLDRNSLAGFEAGQVFFTSVRSPPPLPVK
jgi:hypothetical protein